MKKLLLLPALALTTAAALLSTGCGNVQSPFSMQLPQDNGAVLVEIINANKGNDDAVRVRVNNRRLDNPNELESVLSKISLSHPGRPVTLLVDDDADIKFERTVERYAIFAGLGEVSVLERSQARGEHKTRPVRNSKYSRTTNPAPAPTPAPSATPLPEVSKNNVILPPPVASPPAPDTTALAPNAAAPAPISAPVATPPPVTVTTPAPPPVTIVAQPNGTFLVNGNPVPRADLPAALVEIAAKTPGAKVNYSRDPAAPNDSAIYVYRAAKTAKLGTVTFAQ
jgi:biopolymer transport protein ExbD